MREVYEMVTTQKRPEPGALERQQKRQVRAARNKRNAAFAVAAVIALVAVALILETRRGPNATTPGNEPSTVPPTTVEGIGSLKPAHVGKNAMTVKGIPFSFRVPSSGWERFGNISMNKSTMGPQGAEAIIFWTSFPHSDNADPCAYLLSLPVGSSAAHLAAAVSTAPGTELVMGPSDVTVGGRAAKHVVLTVRENIGCNPGFFYTWQDVMAGALWPRTRVGFTIRVWIIDVDGTRLFIEAETTNQANSDLEQEIQQIVGSIHFD